MSSGQSKLPPALDDVGRLSALESLLLVAGGPVGVSALASALGIGRLEALKALEQLRRRLIGGIRLQLHDDQAQLVTAAENIEFVHRFLGTQRPPGLSRASLETLTVIAYRQPATRSEVEAARGVNSDRAMQTLVARGLIEERGERETIGRPTEFGTTFGFLEYFGLSALDELPPLAITLEVSLDPEVMGMRIVRSSD